MPDYVTFLTVDFRLIGPEIALLLASFVVMLTAFTRRAHTIAPVAAIIGLAVALALSIQQWNNQHSGFAGMVTSDNFGIIFRIIFSAGSLLSLLIAYKFLNVKRIDKPEFYALLLVSTIGMMVMANTTNLIVMFLGLEIMSVPLYIMAALNRRSLESNEAGIKYFIMGAFATAFLLMGIAFVFGAAESTDLRQISSDLSFILARRGAYMLVGAALILIGFAFKVAAVPFHTWVPDVYQGAPTPITAFFSVGPKAAGFAVILRIFNFGFADMEPLTDVFWVLAVLTMTVGNMLALRQNNIKRMLAYSSIAHAGYILVAVAVGGSDAISAAIFYLVAYTLFNLGAFAVISLLETRTGTKSEFSELTGLAKRHPYLAASLALFMFALSGFPPTIGFFGKFYIFSAAVKSGFIWLAVIGVLNSFVSVYYYLRVVKTSYFDEFEGQFAPVALSPSITIVILVTLAGTFGFGFFPEQLLKLSQAAIFTFL
ncbi:MAG: NADH-quinone oxidoreductase subunit N [candidate division Zixibacteria bacterium]|nr:NADH-quinone oxidoreductase subunit N [candidate division Zixibacteria bacterium]